MAERRARERAESKAVESVRPAAATVALPVVVPPGGSVAASIEAELASSVRARFRPGDAARARVIATRLDDPFTPAGAASMLSRELGSILADLREPPASRGALARLREQYGRVLD